jgi:hypothetical protein
MIDRWDYVRGGFQLSLLIRITVSLRDDFIRETRRIESDPLCHRPIVFLRLSPTRREFLAYPTSELEHLSVMYSNIMARQSATKTCANLHTDADKKKRLKIIST